MRALATACVGALLLLVTPVAAMGGLVTSDGMTVTFAETTVGERNSVLVVAEAHGTVRVEDGGAVALHVGGMCTGGAGGRATCPVGTGGIRIDTGAGDDAVRATRVRSFGGIAILLPDGALQVALGDGSDSFSGGRAAEVADGGPGDDRLTGGAGPDQLLGGLGNDRLTGGDGADGLSGGDGDDVLDVVDTDAAADVVDGGAGSDSLAMLRAVSGATVRPGTPPPPLLTVTLDGVADDGRAGEQDNVVDVEHVDLPGGGSFVGDDDGNAVTFGGTAASVAQGHGGDDSFRGGRAVASQRFDGGDGDDRLDGGLGGDTLVGGLGRDLLLGDGDLCRGHGCHSDGDDTIEARDGEVDTIRCGWGRRDRVVADDEDEVARDCEQVEWVTPLGIELMGEPSLPRVLRRGLRLSVGGLDRRARLHATIGQRVADAVGLDGRLTVARGVGAPGPSAVPVRLRFSRPARVRLADARRLVLRVALAGTSERLVVVLRVPQD